MPTVNWTFVGEPEKRKAHEEIPDGLGIGTFECRDGSGQLLVYLRGNNTTPNPAYIVLGKYKKVRDGRQFYVCEKTKGAFGRQTTTHHEDLLMAVSQIMDIANQWSK